MGGSEKNLNFPSIGLHQKVAESGFQMGQPLTFLHSFSTLHPPIWSTTVLCGKKNLSSPVVGPLQPEMAGSGGTDRSRCILCHDMCVFIYHTRRSTRIPVYIYLYTLIHVDILCSEDTGEDSEPRHPAPPSSFTSVSLNMWKGSAL